MKCLRILGVLLVTLTLAWSMTLETTSLRSTTALINNSIKNVSNQLLETNISSLSILDVRTPPRIQERISNRQSIESSHAGVAIPVDDDIDVMEESTKKMNFYKIERPTTSNGGLSTWILLSGQTSSTTSRPMTKKPSVKPLYMKDEKRNETLVVVSEKPIKIGKPIFKERSTSPKPVTVRSIKTTTIRVNTFSPSTKPTSKKPTKLTKVKASLLNNTFNKVNNISMMAKNKTTTATIRISSTTHKPNVFNVSTTIIELPNTTELNKVATRINTSANLPVEAKDAEQELPSSDEKKKKTQKRKKNKNKRRKPAKASKEDNNNKLKEVESAGTQLYSYLRSEIIPVTVGVSLVGLLVTAGLASYYLQPFAALRRSEPIDRNDSDGGYYYHDEYSNSMPEEEAFGKVIAGMPESTLQQSNVLQTNSLSKYKPATSRNTYPQNVRYRHVDRRSQIHMNPYGLVEDVKVSELDRAPVKYDQTSSSYNQDNKFVVGSIQKDVVQEVTPAVVPEHGPRNLKVDEQKFVVGNIPKDFPHFEASPRNLKIRRRREILPDDSENEIFPGENGIDDSERFNQILMRTSTEKVDATTIIEESKETTNEVLTTEETVKETTPHNVWSPDERPESLFELITDLFRLKVRLGLEVIKNVTQSVSSYVSKVQSRLNEHYRHNHSSRNESEHWR